MTISSPNIGQTCVANAFPGLERRSLGSPASDHSVTDLHQPPTKVGGGAKRLTPHAVT